MNPLMPPSSTNKANSARTGASTSHA
ncbi:CopG family transcriptional regulator, partial [Salmonella enterica subsp. enterica serovar Typhimurium]|nr:CopG family transcriptional regulator [Salmonella enterica subsp. enterica serovar Typhimurium]